MGFFLTALGFFAVWIEPWEDSVSIAPLWARWILLVAALLLDAVAIISLKRGYGEKPSEVTDEDVRHAKATLDHLSAEDAEFKHLREALDQKYMRDFGELPHYPEKEKEKTEEQQGL